MDKETIEIVTTKEKFFLEYLILKRPIIDAILTKINRKKTKLSDLPLKVLAQLLYYNDLYREVYNEDETWEKVFSRDVRVEIREKLNLKEHYFNNYISHLRTIKVLEGRKINKIFIVYADEDRELSFKFRLNGHRE